MNVCFLTRCARVCAGSLQVTGGAGALYGKLPMTDCVSKKIKYFVRGIMSFNKLVLQVVIDNLI